MSPEIVEQDEQTVTIKMPTGERITIARKALPKLVEQIEFYLMQRGTTN